MDNHQGTYCAESCAEQDRYPWQPTLGSSLEDRRGVASHGEAIYRILAHKNTDTG
jgi:hypothetical protein